jgi:hypothetical protein
MSGQGVLADLEGYTCPAEMVPGVEHPGLHFPFVELDSDHPGPPAGVLESWSVGVLGTDSKPEDVI